MGIGASVGTIKQTDSQVTMGVGSTSGVAKEVKSEKSKSQLKREAAMAKAAKVEEPKHEVEITQEVMDENPELAGQGVEVGDKVEVEGEVALEDLSWNELRKLATEKGFDGKKQDKQTLLAFLKQ